MLIVMRILGGGAAASVQAVGAGTIAVRLFGIHVSCSKPCIEAGLRSTYSLGMFQSLLCPRNPQEAILSPKS